VESGARILSRSRLVALGVAVATFVAFFPALGAGFVTWDDDRNFLGNPSYRGLGAAQLHWMWTTFHMGHYVPVSWMTLGLDYVVWGMDARGYHLTNLLLHTANALLFFFIARRLYALVGVASADSRGIRAEIPAALAVLFFAIHPLRVESVAWITERRDVLSEFFFLLSVVTYLRATERESRSGKSYWASVVLFVCALLSKATAMSLPVVLAILNVYPLQRLRAPWRSAQAKRVYRELAPFVVLAALIVPLTLAALTRPAQLSLPSKIAVSMYGIAFYLWKTIAPTDLAPLYPMPEHVDPLAIVYLTSAGIVIALCVVFWMLRRRWPGLATAWLAFLVILLPMLGAVQNGPQLVADRYTYHPSPALALMFGAIVAPAWRLPRVRIALASSVCATLGMLTFDQTRIWHDSESLWSHDVRLQPESSIAQLSLARELMKRADYNQAVVHYDEAVRLDPNYAEGHNNYGVALAAVNRPAEAIDQYRAAIALQPTYDEAYTNWGIALTQLGEVAQAIERYQQAIALNPSNATAHTNWGNALVRLGRPADALDHYRAAVAVRPDLAEAHLNWGVALARLRQYPAAVTHFRDALRLDPTNTDAQQYLDRAMQLSQGR
jgi:protein O-mannosyl-transferase